MLANLFLHYAFDNWMAREFPVVAFERYVDDAVVHCVSQAQAHQVLAALRERMRGVGLELHPDKTRVVYCKDSNRRGCYEHTAFTFLGYTFRGREVAGASATSRSRSTATRWAIIDGLVQIVSGEGPVVTNRLYELYVRASGGQRVGKNIRHVLDQATHRGHP